MFSKTVTGRSTTACCADIARLRRALDTADAIVIGAGAGLSASAGYTYDGARFHRYFEDFIAEYGFRDMYSGGFYPFETPEEHWAYWSRYIYINRYLDAPKPVYQDLLQLVQGRDYFVLTTNVDHCFQKAGFDKQRLFYTQGDYGLWQCSRPCCQKTYDNEAAVKKMVAQQRERKIPRELRGRYLCGGRGLARRRPALRSVSALSRRAARAFSGTGRRRQYAGHHQVPILANDPPKPAGRLRLHESGTLLPGGNCGPGALHRRGYRL